MKTHASSVVVLLALAASGLLKAGDGNAAPTLVSVQTAKVVKVALRSETTGFGTVEGAPAPGGGGQAGGANLAAAASGLVLKVLAAEGARVEKGELLVQMDARSADAGLAKARALLDSARKAHARQLAMKSAGGTSERSLLEAATALAAAESEVAAAELAQTQLGIRAPISGVVGRLSVRPGEWLDAGKLAVEIINPASLVVNAEVSAEDAARIRVGAAAGVFSRLGRDDSEIAKGRVTFVSPLAAKDSGNVVIRIALAGTPPVRAGQLVVARIITDERPGCLAVPVESLVEAEGQTVVAVVSGGIARQIPVKVGLRDHGLAEVAGEGIAEGTEVVTVGAYGLPKETKVNVLAR